MFTMLIITICYIISYVNDNVQLHSSNNNNDIMTVRIVNVVKVGTLLYIGICIPNDNAKNCKTYNYIVVVVMLRCVIV